MFNYKDREVPLWNVSAGTAIIKIPERNVVRRERATGSGGRDRPPIRYSSLADVLLSAKILLLLHGSKY